VRQSRFGVKGSQYTDLGELKYEFEFDMFGVGVDAGQTTIRPRHYYGELGPVLAGQTNSVFMDVDVFPNILEYWGPNGMVFLRNPQLRYTPVNGATKFMIALEKPGASGDAGLIADRIDLSNVHARFPKGEVLTSALAPVLPSWMGTLSVEGIPGRWGRANVVAKGDDKAMLSPKQIFERILENRADLGEEKIAD
jgi:hypothetical protein